MRALLPHPVDDPDLVEVYAYPDGRPWLRANMVASVDGAATVEGRSGGLSAPADKRVFGLLRDLADVVLVGAGTVRAEGYAAVTRSEARIARRRRRGLTDTPAIAVVSASLDLDPTGPLFTGAPTRTVLVTTEPAARARGSSYADVAEVITTPGPRVDLARAVDALVATGRPRILCEGGPTLLGQVAAAGRLDELCLTVSPLLAGGYAPRTLAGPSLHPPVPLRLAGLLEDDGMLFCRWLTADGAARRSG